MLKIIAIGITPRIDEVERDRIQEFLDGTHPMSPSRKTYDTGTKRKTVLDKAPAGPNEIADEPGDRTSHDNVGSGYKEGLDPGGQADDETGPGNTPHSDKEQTFTNHSRSELAFKNDGDTSSEWSPLNYRSKKRDRASTSHLMRMQNDSLPLPKRYPVDQLARASSANTAWTHRFGV